jgi:hypothetical protein
VVQSRRIARASGGGSKMSAVDDFKGEFDLEGRWRDQDGWLNVVFAAKGGG